MSGAQSDAPVIIEVAINGARTRKDNPHVPLTSDEIGLDPRLRCRGRVNYPRTCRTAHYGVWRSSRQRGLY